MAGEPQAPRFRPTIRLRTERKGLRVVRVNVRPDQGGAPPFRVLQPEGDKNALPLELSLAKGEAMRPGAELGSIEIYVTDPYTPVVTVPYELYDNEERKRRADLAKAQRVRLQPLDLRLAGVFAGETRELPLLVKSISPKPIEISDLRVEGPAFLSVRSESQRDGRRAQISLQLREAWAGPIDAVVRFRARPGEGLLSIPIRGRVAATVLAVPTAVYLSAAHRTGSFLVQASGANGPVEISAVEVVSGAIAVEVGERTEAGVRVWVHARRGESGRLTGEVRVETTLMQGALQIPVFGDL